MTAQTHPLDDIRALIQTVPAMDDQSSEQVKQALLKAPGPKPALGHWSKQLSWLAGWQGQAAPTVDRPLIAVFAGTHQVAEGQFDTPIREVARARVDNLTQGQAGIRGMASRLGAAFKVYEMGLEVPAADMTQEPSLSERDCAGAIAFGMEVVAEGADIIVLGNAGVGTATAAAAIVRGLYGGASDYWAGAHDKSAKGRIAAVEKATMVQSDRLSDPLEALRCFGGRDLAGLVGAIVAARHQRIPVILDGFIVCAAAAVIHAVNPDATAHCMAGHQTIEPAHGALLDRLGLTPLHEFGIPVGDGTGATMALGTLRTAVAGLGAMVSDK